MGLIWQQVTHSASAGLHDMIPGHMTEYSIGLDLGGTNLRVAAIDRRGMMLDKISGATDFKAGRDAVLGDIAASIAKLRDKHGAGALVSGRRPAYPHEGRLITGSNNLPFLKTSRCATI